MPFGGTDPSTCPTCGGDGYIVEFEELCTTCFGSGSTHLQGVAYHTLKYLSNVIDSLSDLVDTLDDVVDKCDDIMDKCNDIFEKVNE